ncbi:MAG: tRNA (adenosine(37)-N6)-dimethylallyltransferase MiaA, partial [Candidatus Omnitrophota bacterium]
QKLRNKLYKEVELYGKPYLYEKLVKADLRAAAKIHPNDLFRVIRALEVYYLTGKPISELQQRKEGIMDKYNVAIIGLDMARSALYQKINERTEEMFTQGLIAEVKKILDKKLSLTARQAIGIKEVKGYLEGRYSLEEAKDILSRNTRHYAKRQLSWFRQDKRIKWIKITKNDTPKKMIEKIIKKI